MPAREVEVPLPEPDDRCVTCGKRFEDHGLMFRNCFIRGKAMRTRFKAVED